MKEILGQSVSKSAKTSRKSLKNLSDDATETTGGVLDNLPIYSAGSITTLRNHHSSSRKCKSNRWVSTIFPKTVIYSEPKISSSISATFGQDGRVCVVRVDGDWIETDYGWVKTKSVIFVLNPKKGLTLSQKLSQADRAGPLNKSGNYKTALRALRPLAEQGSSRAQFRLGAMYARGQGVPKNYKSAVKWWKLAAEQRNANAQINLGFMYLKGRGVSQNYKTAVKWYKLAAEQGHALAQFSLGLMYRKGNGVPQNNKTAVLWYRLAAKQGHATAQSNLASMYAFGRGVLKDYVRAYMWGNIAATNGSKLGAKLRDDFEKKMIPADISKAQDLARKCVREKYKGC